MENNTQARKTIKTRIFACGGTGIKNVSRFAANAKQDGLNHLEFCYLDTSDSDVPANIEPSLMHHFRNMEGGGKDRKFAYEQVLPMIAEVLQKFPAEDFNIIVHSSSGASGPSVGPALVSKLLEAGKHVLVIQAGSTGSKKEVENTIGTIKSYANFASKYNRPVLSYYRETNETTSRNRVDDDMQSALTLCSILFSAENRGIDTADLRNLIDYNKVTSFKPELSSFDFYCRNIDLPDNLIPQVAAVLYKHDEDFSELTETSSSLEYRADGFLSKTRSEQMGDRLPVHFVVYSGDLADHLSNLNTRLNAFKAKEQARERQHVRVEVTETANDDGMVF